MRTTMISLSLAALAFPLLTGYAASEEPAAVPDWRAFESGHQIYSSGYIDQPYVVVLKDGTWVCVFTTGAGKEGQGGQHVVASRSTDMGRTWSEPVDIEPSDGPAASWVMPYLTKYGRVYAFYDYNGDRVETLKDKKIRNDMLGWYCFKYSDDGGSTWSERHRLPVRKTACDRTNDWKGEVQILWGIGKPVDVDEGMMLGFTKLGKYVLDLGEGWFFRCDNINTEKNAGKLDWQMLPEGDRGVRYEPFGSVQEEHNLVQMSDGGLYCVYRTRLGHPVESYSHDGGKTWSEPQLMRYADGTPVKTPRACPRLFRCSNGKYLFWFHNHSGTSYENRNPAWVSGGVERDGRILWSQPEILIYSHNTSQPHGRFSYPDLVERDGRFWITCTNKETARVHEVPDGFFEGLWAQLMKKPAIRRPKPVVDATAKELAAGVVDMRPPKKPSAHLRMDTTEEGDGFTLDMTLQFDHVQPGHVLFDARDNSGRGLCITTTGFRQLEVSISTGERVATWTTDPGLLTLAGPHRVMAIVDNGPNIITWLVDGKLCDGGESRQYGWTRYDRYLGQIRISETAKVSPTNVKELRFFGRALRTSEAVALQKAVKRK